MRDRSYGRTDVVLVSMPWDMLEIPSIQTGTLSAVLEREGVSVSTRAYKFDFIDRCVRETADRPEGERLAARDYLAVAHRCDAALGDWVFAVPPFAPPRPRRDEDYLTLLQREYGVSEELVAIARRFREHVAPFATECVDDLVASGARVVGFSSTFSQNVATLLVARLVKERAPHVAVVLGGTNFDGVMGASVHRSFRWVDYVVRGEGERALPALARALLEGQPVPRLPGLCHWVNGESVAEPETHETVPMAEVPAPDYREFFESFEASAVRPEITTDVRLMVETSRGCWWGEKQHCTFCGLNGATMKYRSKPPEVAVREIESLSQRYKRLDFQVVDNILDMTYFKDVLPQLRDRGLDIKLFYETKANLRRDQVKLLAEAGIDRIQPGIESLSTPILKRMRKGVTAFQNIRLLKWCAEYGVSVYWNILCGFPGEPVDEYARMAALIPSITHLDPPDGVGNLRVDRFSPYEREAAQHGIELLGPRKHFQYVYDLPPDDLRDLAYAFEYRHHDGRDVALYTAPVREAAKAWIDHGPEGSLVWRRGPGFVVVNDRRYGLEANDYTLDDAAAVAFETCADGATPEAILRAIHAAGLPEPAPGNLEELLAQLFDLRLAVEEDGKVLTLAVPARPRAAPAAPADEARAERPARAVRVLPLAG
jgi:ribosomal peptide maturation radical SAM protein 1